jgi:hypothetical protein
MILALQSGATSDTACVCMLYISPQSQRRIAHLLHAHVIGILNLLRPLLMVVLLQLPMLLIQRRVSMATDQGSRRVSIQTQQMQQLSNGDAHSEHLALTHTAKKENVAKPSQA